MLKNFGRFVGWMGLLAFLWVGCQPTPPTEEPTPTEAIPDATTKADDSPKDTTTTPEPTPEPTLDTTTPDAAGEPTPETKPEPAQPDTTTTPDKATPPEQPPGETGPDMNFPGMTYWKDIKNILDKRCTTCHFEGGIAPFALTTYKAANTYKTIVKTEVQAGRMPPWQADKSCGDYSNDISLEPQEKAKLIQWIDQGAPEGDPKDHVQPPPPPPIGLKRVDLTLKMPKVYNIKKTPDDYRCFVVDWTPTTAKYITGFQIKPGNPKIVHHVIAYMAKASEVSTYTKKDPNGDGYTCYGTAGGPAGLRWIGVWAPGVPGAEYPANTGIKVEPGGKLIIQLHYNTTNTTETDQTSVDFTLEDKVTHEAILFPYTNPQWLKGENAPADQSMKIPAGSTNTEHTFSLPLSFLGIIAPKVKNITVYSAMLHMHQLGSSGTLNYRGNQCLLNVPKWNFNWQLMYNLKNPVTLGLSDTVGVTCKWDNSAANQPIIDGQKQTPKDVYWGDGTHDEMCLGVVYITCTDDQKQDTPCPDLAGFINRIP